MRTRITVVLRVVVLVLELGTRVRVRVRVQVPRVVGRRMGEAGPGARRRRLLP